VTYAAEHKTLSVEVGPEWWQSVPRAELSYGPVHERDTVSVPNPSVSLIGDRQPTVRPFASMRDLVNRHILPSHPLASHPMIRTRDGRQRSINLCSRRKSGV
jgi:hypothetical protein